MRSKKIYEIIITKLTLLFAISIVSCNHIQKDSLKCNYQENYFLDVKNMNIHICAFQNDDDSSLTELTIYNSLNDSIIFDTKGDAISNYTLMNKGNSISIFNHVYFPAGNNFEDIIDIPSEEILINIDNNQVINLSNHNIFKYPQLSISQIDSITNLCNILNHIISNKAKIQPYLLPYETLFIIYIGAYHQIGNAKDIWIKLPERFEFDGAASETISDLQNIDYVNH